jgi:hypothetical protein
LAVQSEERAQMDAGTFDTSRLPHLRVADGSGRAPRRAPLRGFTRITVADGAAPGGLLPSPTSRETEYRSCALRKRAVPKGPARDGLVTRHKGAAEAVSYADT